MEWLNAIVLGTLPGRLYVLFVAGFPLIFGAMRLATFARGDLIVLSAFLGLSVIKATGMHPLLALVILVLATAAIG